ncbi:MAG: hypothetical protein EB084_02480 [Proteobacteria bacterium]|nr:hypothetical protein [Pseudomonadota bacterium]
MNAAILEVAQKIADGNDLSIRDVIARFRRAGVQFRTETTRSYDTSPQDENVLLGYSFEGFFYPYSEEENRALLEKLVLQARPRETRPADLN